MVIARPAPFVKTASHAVLLDTARLSLCASEGEKRQNVVPVGGAKSVDVAAPEVSGVHHICSAPSEYRSALSLRKDIGHESGVTAIAVGERMDEDESVMKSDSRFVRLERSMFHPVTNIAQESRQ